jgi:hypothetical protein
MEYLGVCRPSSRSRIRTTAEVLTPNVEDPVLAHGVPVSAIFS